MTEAPLIAVVDDDASFRDALADLMLFAGFRVEAFASGDAILASGRTLAFQAFLLDVQMPGLGGLEVLSRLRADGVAAPVVFVTSTDDRRTCDKARAAGALAVFGKPCDPDQLVGVMREALA